MQRAEGQRLHASDLALPSTALLKSISAQLVVHNRLLNAFATVHNEWPHLDYGLAERFTGNQNEAAVVFSSRHRDAGAVAVGRQEKGIVFLELLSFDLDRPGEC